MDKLLCSTHWRDSNYFSFNNNVSNRYQAFKKPFWVFEVFGTNSIFIFILSGLWVKTIINIKRDLNGEMTSAYNYLYKTIFVPLAGDLNGSLYLLLHM